MNSKKMRVDDCARQSMAIYAFPCPPLPQHVLRAEGRENDLVSSHDLVVTGMTYAQSKTESRLREQAENQLELQNRYNGIMDDIYRDYKQDGQTDGVWSRSHALCL